MPLEEGPAEAGAGRILSDLARARIESLARPIGARVSATRTPWGLAYGVVGAVADFEYLAYLVREAVARPELEGVALSEARRSLASELARTAEVPRARVADELRRRVAPDRPPVYGSEAALDGLGAARLAAVWRRSHLPDSMTLVVVAGVAPEVVLAATRGMGSDGPAAAPLDAPSTPGRARPSETLRTWYGEAWMGGAPGDPAAPVAARLVDERLRAVAADFEVGVRLWELPDRWALAAIGVAPVRDAGALRRAVSGVLSGVRDGLTPGRVVVVAARLRWETLLRARTPDGLAAVVGRAAERSRDPGAARRDLEALTRLGTEEVRRFLDALLDAGPVRSEIRP